MTISGGESEMAVRMQHSREAQRDAYVHFIAQALIGGSRQGQSGLSVKG